MLLLYLATRIYCNLLFFEQLKFVVFQNSLQKKSPANCFRGNNENELTAIYSVDVNDDDVVDDDNDDNGDVNVVMIYDNKVPGCSWMQ